MIQSLKLDLALSKAMRPIVKRLFKKESDEAYTWICINLAANMLGMGGVATPAGIKAIGAMRDNGYKASDNMIMLLAINATSIQLVPATIIAIRASAGAKNGADIFFPTLISSGVATACAMIMCKILSLKDRKDNTSINYHIDTLTYGNRKIKPALRKNNHIIKGVNKRR